MNKNPVTQRKGFREAEAQQLFRWAKAGESASIVGISGVGKSNLFNHLRDPQTQAEFLGKLDRETILVRTNFHYIPDFSDRAIYSLILEQLELLYDDAKRLGLTTEAIDEVGRLHEMLLNAGDDPLKIQRYFKLAIRALLGNASRRLVFLFDQFDDVFQEADSRLFANLRGLREAYKYRISYFVFTRDLLSNLVEMDLGREEFYELLAANVMGLKPYNQADAYSLMSRVAERNQLEVPETMRGQLYKLAGGHAGLLRAVLLAVMQKGLSLDAEPKEVIQSLLGHSGVDIECYKIWRSLSVQEQRVSAYLVHQVPLNEEDQQMLWQLKLKGLLTEAAEPEIFSPVFALYVGEQEALWERPIFFDESARQVWVLGQPAARLTQLEFRLFRLLHQRAGEVVVKDELIDAGWPKAKGGVSDEALIAAIARLRKKIEPDSKNPRFVHNVHNQGYVFKSGEE